jgi:serine/threonine protein phosphatase PrpC
VSDPTTTGTAVWRAVSASRRGSAHADGVPNQDAVHLRRVSTPTGDVWVVGVADGHGGARYVRSDVGARAAVDVTVQAVGDALAEGDEPAAVLRATVPRIVEEWLDRVGTDARERPFTEDELARGPAPGSAAYGATLLVAVVGDHGVALAQVGDGDALVRSHGFATRPVPGDDRLVAGETTSLCLDSAVDDFRYAVVPATADPDLVLLATDGYGNSFALTDWWRGLVDDVATLVSRGGFDRVAEDLPGWLDESARVGGDDVTAVLLVRDPLVDGMDGMVIVPARTKEIPDAAEGVPRAAEPSASRARPRGVLAALAAAAVVLAVLAALFLLGPGRSDEPPSGPTVPGSTTEPSNNGTDSDGTGSEGTDKDREKRPRDDTSPGPKGPEKKAEEDTDKNKDDDTEEPPDDPARPVPGQD